MEKQLLFCLFLLNALSFCLCETKFSLPLVQKSRSRLEVQKYFKQQEVLKGKGSKFLLNNYPHDYVSVNVSIGSPPQTFELSVETGRPDIWVLWEYFENARPGQHLYNPDDSTTSDYYGYFEGRSANLFISGEGYTDKLDLGEITFNQTIGTATEIYNDIEDTEFALDGVLGLSWDPDYDYKSPIENILKQSGIKDKIYTIWLGPHVKPSEGNGEGALSIGTDDKHCDTKINYIKLSQFDTYMIFQVTGFTFGKYSSMISENAVIDSGFPLILFNTDTYRSVYKQINPGYDWDDSLLTVNCADASNFADWKFTIGGQDYSIPSSQYVLDLELPNGQCAVAFGLNSNDDLPTYVLGNVFLRQYCTTYNIKTSQIGLSASTTGNFN